MQSPPKSADEDARAAALRGLGILDTAPEERFDRYTRLARRMFGVPIALVSLVDEERQWFKSCQGLDVSETPREVSFCGHAIADRELFVIEDALGDERFADNPLVSGDPRIRFYAGFPLAGTGGYRVGTLCIIDQRPRTLDAADREALCDLGSMVASELSAIRLATVDPLTRLSNRRGFAALAKRAVAAAARAEIPATVMAIDMDGFKAINDELGHDAGDRVLTEFAEILLATVRESDVVARLGGDEFCVLLSGADEHSGRAALQRLHAAVKNRNDNAGEFRLAFSAGLAQVEERGLEDALRKADERMYRDKRKRRAA